MDPVSIIPISHTPMPCHSGRVVKQPDQFMYLGESFETILEEHEIDPIDYDETISDVDAHLWQKLQRQS